jgi:hypothetical protein
MNHHGDALWEPGFHKYNVTAFIAELDALLGGAEFSAFTDQMLDDLIGTLRKSGNSNATINRKMAALSKLLRKAYKMGEVHSLPEFRRQKERAGRIRFLEVHEEVLLFAAIADKSKHYANLCTFLVDTGARIGEAIQLRWGDNVTNFDSIAYTYDGGTWRAGISLDELSGKAHDADDASLGTHHDLGVAGTVGFSLGGVNLDVLGGYDGWADEGAIRAILSADVGPGTFQLAGIWASDQNVYWAASEWTVAASYAFKATEKLTITPAAQYFGDLGFKSDADMWRVGLTVGYQVVEGLDLLATVDYNNVDETGVDSEDFTRGFLRLQRNF